MTCKDSHFLIGLGVGSILGALAYGFARSARAKKMKAEVFDALHRIEAVSYTHLTLPTKA